MKKLFIVLVSLITFVSVTTAQYQQWSCTATVENIDVEFHAVTIEGTIDAYYITAGGLVDEGWTADVWGDMFYTGPTGFGWEGEYVYFYGEPKSELCFWIYLTDPEGGYKMLEIYLYYSEDLGGFQLLTDVY